MVQTPAGGVADEPFGPAARDVGRAGADASDPGMPDAPRDRPASWAAQRAAARHAAEDAAAQARRLGVEGVAVEPPPAPREPTAKLVLAPPHPMRGVWLANWPLVACVLLAAFIVGMAFPLLGAPLLVFVPVATAAAFVLSARRARAIRLEVSEDAIRVSNAKLGVSAQRVDVAVGVLVERFARGPLTPATTDLILLDRPGRTMLVLTGLLWPPQLLDQVAAALSPIPIERAVGRQTAATLAARYPKILGRADRTRGPRALSGTGMLITLLVLLAGAITVAVKMFIAG